MATTISGRTISMTMVGRTNRVDKPNLRTGKRLRPQPREAIGTGVLR